MPRKENPENILKIDIPLFIRLLEFAREDASGDLDLHEVADKAIALGDKILSMDDYEALVPEPKEEKESKPKRKHKKDDGGSGEMSDLNDAGDADASEHDTAPIFSAQGSANSIVAAYLSKKHKLTGKLK